MFVAVRKVAGRKNVEIPVFVEVRDFGPRCSIYREKETLMKIVVAVILQDPDAMVRL